MKKLKVYAALVVGFCMGVTSCSPKLTTVYYYDNTKLDDGDIGAKEVYLFFQEDKNVHIYQVRSNRFNSELQKIKDTVSLTSKDQEFDDSFYGYAFITATKDTLFADYKLSHWRYKEGTTYYKGEILKAIFDKAKAP